MSLQRTPDWDLKRLGIPTTSRYKDILAKTKTGESASRANYIAQLVAERLTGKPYEMYQSSAMQFGTDNENAARQAYMDATQNKVEEVCFIRHAYLETGCSPDGLIGDDGLIEIKVPNTLTHLETVRKGMNPSHLAQIQGQMWVTDRKWCDFVSYDPRLVRDDIEPWDEDEIGLELYIQRIERNEEHIETLEKEVKRFLVDVEAMVKELKQLQQRRAA